MTRTPGDIANLFAYGRWATAKTLESAAALDAEEFGKPIGGSFGSVQGTLAHLYGADWVWLERFHGRSPSALPGAESLTSLATIRERWEPVHRGLREFVDALAPARLAEPLWGTTKTTRPTGPTISLVPTCSASMARTSSRASPR